MKRVLFLLAVFVSFSFSASNEQIIAHFKSQIGLDGLTYEVKSRDKIKGYPEYEKVVLVIKQNAGDNIHHSASSNELNIIVRDGIIFPDAVDVSKNRSLLEE